MVEGYSQNELDKESRKMVVINVFYCLYQYRHLPFGLSCVHPAIFYKIHNAAIIDVMKCCITKVMLIHNVEGKCNISIEQEEPISSRVNTHTYIQYFKDKNKLKKLRCNYIGT